jgi:hypothetical protein
MFSQRPLDTSSLTLDGKPLECLPPVHTGRPRRIWCWSAPGRADLYLPLDYASSLFLPETAAYFTRCYNGGAPRDAGVPVQVSQRGERSVGARPGRAHRPSEPHGDALCQPASIACGGAAEKEPDAPAILFHGKDDDPRELRCAPLRARESAGTGRCETGARTWASSCAAAWTSWPPCWPY